MNKQPNVGRAVLALGAALVLVGASTPASAQEMDARLLPWVGCWAPSTQQETGMDLVCVRPAEQQGAIELLRISNNVIGAREVIWADGQRHDTSRESCNGWERGSFSQDGRRLFLEGEYTCNGVTQKTGGILAMASPVAWIDVRVAGNEGDEVAWLQRYHTATAQAAEDAGFGDLVADRAWAIASARIAASGEMDVDDIIEASAQVSDQAVQALLAERGDRFELSADELIRMADAGVSEEVIDVAVAVSYPDRFQLNAGDPGQEMAVSALDRGSLRRRWAYAGAMGPAFYDPFYAPWSLRFGYGNGWYGYDPYGWGYGYGYRYGGGYGYGGYRPTVIVVDQAPREHGRVINGRGYSRGRSPGASGGSGGSYVPSRSGGGGSGTGATSGGASSSSGSRGTSTGRTAKPRGGGGF